MKTKYIIVIVIVLIAIAFLLRIGYLIAPGTYPESENYVINTSQINLLSKIDSLKLNNSQYKVPGLVDQYDSIRRSYNIYIYNYSKNQIIHLESQQEDKNKSIIHFIGINQGLTLGNWKIINKDFDSKENEAVLTDFEGNVLNRLGVSFKRE